MSQTPPNSPGSNPNAPVMRVLNQYIKDLSFENPNAPQANRADLPAPAVDVAVDVNARRLGDDQYEVELSCSATATREGDTVFVVEANYAGLFQIQNIPNEQLEGALLVAAPQLLFPFARQVVAQATRDGGFMPLMLEPLDFAGMYQMQMRRRAAEAQAQANGQAQPPQGGEG
jgi:preprotein translocase subunit SecB